MTGASVMPRLFAAIVLVFLVTPLVLCVLFSFTTGASASFPIPALGFAWYRRIAANDQFWEAASVTARITFGCGLAATAIGLCTALGLARLQRRWAVLALLALSLPLMLPPLVLGLSLLSYFALIGLQLGVVATILAHLVFTMPFVTAILYARLITLDHAVLEAARDLGASPLRAFRDITLPAIGPTLVGGMLVAMALSLDDFVIAFYTAGRNTLSTLIWGMMRTTINPGINVVGTVIIVLSILITTFALRITRYRG